MSLINDALKRAKQSQQPQQQAPTPPLVPPVSAQSDGQGGANWLFSVLLVALIIGASVLLGLAFLPRKPMPQTTPSAVPAPSAQIPVPASVAVKPPAPATALAPTQSVAVVAPPPPALKVQGIFYNSDRPQAIVNGRTVYIGDNVSGFQVKLISQDKVSFIAPDGSEKTLALGE